MRADRLRELMAERAVSQSELARRIGVSQTTIAKLASGTGYGSKFLHKIARELGTTPAYLDGETDDFAIYGEPMPPLTFDERTAIEYLQGSSKQQRRTMMTVLAALSGQPILPSEAALTRMFEGLLAASPRLHGAELAHELAKRLPTALAVVRGPLIEPAADEHGEAPAPPEAPPIDRPARRRASRT